MHVISGVRYIEAFDFTNFLENNQNVRFNGEVIYSLLMITHD